MNSLFFHIEIDFFMCILLSIIIIHSLLQLNLNLLRYKLFISATSCTLLNLVAEIIINVMRNKYDNSLYSIFIQKLLHILNFAFSPFMCVLILFFIIKSTTGKLDKQMAIICLIPIVLNFIVSILSYNMNIFFNISETNVYSRGELFFIAPIISVLYYLIIASYVLKNKYYLEKDEIFVFINVIFIPFVLGTIQILNSSYLTIWASYALSMVILYIFILNDNSKRDPLTSLGNKIKFYECIHMYSKKTCNNLTIISFDLDDFKNINDTYGHEQGDLAIKSFARLMYKTFKKKSKIIRFGGDEFIVFTLNNKVNELLKVLTMEIDKYNSSDAVPFDIKFSYGIANMDSEKNQGLSVEELVKKSDDSLYIYKRQKKQA